MSTEINKLITQNIIDDPADLILELIDFDNLQMFADDSEEDINLNKLTTEIRGIINNI